MATSSRAIPLETTTFNLAESEVEALNQTCQQGLSDSSARLGKEFGWFRIGLGLADLIASSAIARLSGVLNKRTGLIQLYGLHELAGIRLFSSQKKLASAVCSRIAGDRGRANAKHLRAQTTSCLSLH